MTDAATYAAALFREVLLERGLVLHGGLGSTDAGAPSPVTGRKVFAPAVQEEAKALHVLARHRSPPLQEMLEVIQHQSHNFMVAFLAYMARSADARTFTESLPVAGEARRFRRMGGTPAAGNLRAKTGTIDQADGEMLPFSIIGNDLPSVARGKYIENLLGAWLAAFRRHGALGGGGGVEGEAVDTNEEVTREGRRVERPYALPAGRGDRGRPPRPYPWNPTTGRTGYRRPCSSTPSARVRECFALSPGRLSTAVAPPPSP